MVENRKLFYAISVLLLSCCQIITMFPHNADSELLGGGAGIDSNNNGRSSNFNRNNASSNADTSNNSEYNRANVDSSSNQSYGNNDADSEFIIAVERKHQQHQQQQQHHHHQTMENPNEGLITGNVGVWEAPDSDSKATENVDDLIFLDKRPINQHQQEQLQQQTLQRVYVAQLPPRPTNDQQKQLHRHEHFEIHHHLSADGNDSGSSSSSSSSSSSTSDEHSDSLTHTTFASATSEAVVAASKYDVGDDMADGELETETTDADAAMPPHEIELQPDNNEEVSGATLAAVTPLDLSDFLSLIPAAKVKAIVAHYYHNDPEVQRAHAFLSSRDFISLKHHIIAIPEMSAFLRYLNGSGLDLVKFVTTLTNMTTVVSSVATTTEKGQMLVNATSTFETNDIEYAEKPSETTPTPPTPTTPANIEIQTLPPSSSSALESGFTPIPTSATETATAASATIGMETTTAKEQLNGLHGLVDSILDVLPQDQILATFFDKLESNAQFSKLVDNIGSPEFSKILNNMQNSVPLRNLIFTLHNNGIYVIRIVDSLKSYFFLGGF